MIFKCLTSDERFPWFVKGESYLGRKNNFPGYYILNDSTEKNNEWRCATRKDGIVFMMGCAGITFEVLK